MQKTTLKKGEYLDALLRSDNTVFSTREVALLWGESNFSAVKSRLNDYAKRGKLIRLRRGIYAKSTDYDTYELATTIYTPSYVSFETVLAQAGVVFQYYNRVFAASYLSREIVVDGRTYQYRKLKDEILTAEEGVNQKDNYYIASPERAFLDIVYLNKGYHFDNLSPLDWDEVGRILPIYRNLAMEKRVNQYQKHA